MSKTYVIFLLILTFLVSGCESRTYENPFDPHVQSHVWAPASLSAETDARGQIHLSWEPRAIIETGYKIQRRENDSDFVTLDSTFETRYVDSPPDHSRIYGYQVRACLNDKLSTPTNIQSIRWIPLGEQIWTYAIGHFGSSTLAFSPDNRYLATGSTGLVNNEYCGPVTLFDAESGGILWTGYHSWGVTALVFSRDNTILLSGSEDTLIKAWDVENGDLLWQNTHPYRINTVDISGDGTQAASGCNAGYVRVWNAETGARLWQHRHTHPTWRVAVYDVAFHPEKHQLASAGGEYILKCFNSDTGELIWQEDIGAQINQIRYSHSGNWILAGGGGYQSGWIRLMDSQSGNGVWNISLSEQIMSLDICPGDTLIAAGDAQGNIYIYHIESETLLREFNHGGLINSLCFSPDAFKILTAGNNNMVKVWDTGTGELLWTGTQNREIYTARFSPNGQKLASISYDGQVKCWRALNNWIIFNGE
jgi:WD40 repeat protein